MTPTAGSKGIDLTLADGTDIAVQADLVIGADGLRSSVARAVGAPITHQGQHASASVIRYYDGLGPETGIDLNAYRWIYRPEIGGGIIPTLFKILDRIASHQWDLDELKGLHRGLSQLPYGPADR